MSVRERGVREMGEYERGEEVEYLVMGGAGVQQ